MRSNKNTWIEQFIILNNLNRLRAELIFSLSGSKAIIRSKKGNYRIESLLSIKNSFVINKLMKNT